MSEIPEARISQLTSEWALMRSIDLTEDDAKKKLILTHKEVCDIVLFAKNGGYGKKFLYLVDKLNETIIKINQVTGEQTVNDIIKLITVAKNDYNALISFQNWYPEDMKPFSSYIKGLQNILIFVLEDLALKYKDIEQNFKVVIKEIKEIPTTSKFEVAKDVLVRSTVAIGIFAIFSAQYMVQSSLSKWKLYLSGVTLTIMGVFSLLETLCSESFTTRDINLIGLRKLSHVINLLIMALREKMYYEEDNCKNYRTYLETIKSIEEEYNSIIDLNFNLRNKSYD